MTISSLASRTIRVLAVAVAGLVLAAQTAAAQAADEFHVGDRIALTIEGIGQPATTQSSAGPQAFSDTVVVREGLVLRLPVFGDIPLAGVKRADAQKYLTQQLRKFVKDPIVHAVPLVRVAILGQVARPGFYSVPSDMLLSDVVMRAGGPTGEADLNKTVVKRDGTEILSQKQAQAAFSAGQTLDELALAPGDEVVVGEKSHLGFGTILQVVGVTASLLGVLLALSYRR